MTSTIQEEHQQWNEGAEAKTSGSGRKMPAESAARLDSLKSGPWSKRAELAWKQVALEELPSFAETAPGTPLTLNSAFAQFDSTKQQWLARVLRPHWDDPIGPDEIPVRDSLDEALTYFQLCELAVETGYISVEDARKEARDKLIRLLWAPAAQQFVRQYDYVAVGFLAARFDIDIGYGFKASPAINQGAEGRFAQFLSQHRLWYGADVECWLDFLDDYYPVDNPESDKEIIFRFLCGNSRKGDNEESIWRFICSAERFLTLLSDLYVSLTADERPRYGLFYLYWMAKMLGWSSRPEGFFRDEKQVDWGEAIATSEGLRKHYDALAEQLKQQGESGHINLWQMYKKDVERRLQHLRSWWAETLGLVNSLKEAQRRSSP